MIEDIVKNLEKGKYLLENIDDAIYSDKSIAPYFSSIGEHLRHVLDTFTCVLKGMELGSINLTDRDRNYNVENYTNCGLEYFDKVINQLKKIDTSQLSKRIQLIDDLGSGCCAVNSTYEAVLMQAHSHAIHHFATVGYTMYALNIYLPLDSFGVNATTPQK